MDKTTIKYYVEDEIEKGYKVVIDSCNFSDDKKYIQIVYHDEKYILIGEYEHTKIATRRTKHYENWEKVYYRKLKIEKLWMKK